MARGKLISEFERDVIRIGHSRGMFPLEISKFLGRTRVAVHVQIEKMKEDGTIDNVPLSFVADEIAEAIRGKK